MHTQGDVYQKINQKSKIVMFSFFFVGKVLTLLCQEGLAGFVCQPMSTPLSFGSKMHHFSYFDTRPTALKSTNYNLIFVCLVLALHVSLIAFIVAHGTDVNVGVRLFSVETLLQAKISIGHRWDQWYQQWVYAS